ncbi:MAG: phosphoadenylyl-sulfate reductase [Solirubrobacteraceae bacterium]
MRGLGASIDVARSLTDTLRHAACHERLVLLCSFQKEESVILDELLAIAPHVRVVTIDTGVLFAETLDTWRRFEEHYGVKVEVEEAKGSAWTGPEHCCGAEKVAALDRALAGAGAWITGLRRAQGATRALTEPVSVERGAKRRGIMKYSPLAHWTERDLWQRIHERGLPYHPLHDIGYESIGCEPCTRPGGGRQGRWAGTDKTECGLHV